MKNIPAARYRFSAKHNGYVDQQYQSQGAEPGAVLSLQPGQTLDSVVFRMTLAAVITGKVNDSDGESMAGIQVVALHRPTEDEIAENSSHSRRQELAQVEGAQTDDRGQYRLYGLKPGEYYIRAVDQFTPSAIVPDSEADWMLQESIGSEYAPVYYPGVTQLSQAEAVTIGAGEETQLDFTMVRIKTVEVSGRVIGPDGKSTTDAFVILEENPPSDYSFGHTATLDDKGHFTLKGVPPGMYFVIAVQRSATVLGSGYHARQKIEVGTDNIESVTLALGQGVRLAGQMEVLGGSVHFERMSVSLDSSEEEINAGWAHVNKDGSFEMTDVPEGNFSLNVAGLDQGWYVKSARLGPENILENGLQLEKGQGGGTIHVIISQSGAQLDGQVKQDGKPVVGARVRLTPDPETAYNRERARTTSTDQDGRFSVAGIAPGQYKLSAKSSRSEAAKPATSDPQFFSLAEREHKSLELTVAPPQAQ